MLIFFLLKMNSSKARFNLHITRSFRLLFQAVWKEMWLCELLPESERITTTHMQGGVPMVLFSESYPFGNVNLLPVNAFQTILLFCRSGFNCFWQGNMLIWLFFAIRGCKFVFFLRLLSEDGPDKGEVTEFCTMDRVFFVGWDKNYPKKAPCF